MVGFYHIHQAGEVEIFLPVYFMVFLFADLITLKNRLYAQKILVLLYYDIQQKKLSPSSPPIYNIVLLLLEISNVVFYFCKAEINIWVE